MWDPHAAAHAHDRKVETDIAGMDVPAPNIYWRQIRAYLQRKTDRGQIRSGVRALVQLDRAPDMQITAGPAIYKSPCDACIQFHSGAQLSFGLTLRRDGNRSRLLAYRFHLALPGYSGLSFIRIDLNFLTDGCDPLQIPRSHFHPGFENIHLPFPVLSPLEILDRIFHVIEPSFTR